MAKKALGIDYPITKGSSFFKQTFDTLSNVKAKINILFRTMENERPFSPDFGLGLYRFVFEPITQDRLDFIQSEIERKVAKYIPEVNIDNLELNEDFDVNADNNILKVKIGFSLKNNPNLSDVINMEFNG